MEVSEDFKKNLKQEDTKNKGFIKKNIGISSGCTFIYKLEEFQEATLQQVKLLKFQVGAPRFIKCNVKV